MNVKSTTGIFYIDDVNGKSLVALETLEPHYRIDYDYFNISWISCPDPMLTCWFDGTNI